MCFANQESSSVHRDDTLHADVVGVGLDARWYEGAAQRSKSLLYFAVSYWDSSPCSWSNLTSESDQKKRFTEAYTVSKKLEIGNKNVEKVRPH